MMEIDTGLLCRGCLVQTGEMKSMSEWGLSEDFSKITNVQVSKSEGVSELLCCKCEEMLLTCQRWIVQCQESNLFLMNTAKKKRSLLHAHNGVESSKKNLNTNTISCLLFENNLVVTVLAPDAQKKIILPCPYQCEGQFTKKSDLLHHMTSFHKVGTNFAVDIQYYCSFENCSYYLNSGQSKFFSARKFLNQHYNKVHKEKIFCNICKLGFPTDADYTRHLKTCNFRYECQECNIEYKTNELLLVHLLRKHPLLHQQYKSERAAKRKSLSLTGDPKKVRNEEKYDYFCDSPKRSFATQTLDNIKNDVSLSSWRKDDAKRDEISTQTVFEDLLSFKSSDDQDSIFSAETVSLSDIQTQTFPLEFGLSRSNKETLTNETQSPDLSLKGTQTCFCLYDSSTSNSSNKTGKVISTETQTANHSKHIADEFLSFNTTETQTCFDEVESL